MSYNIEVKIDKPIQLKTAGKYCDKDIVVTAKLAQNGIDALLDRSIKEVSSNITTSIDNYTFFNCRKLTSVNIPNATSIGSGVFSCCSALPSVNFPNVTSIGYSAFESCSALTSVNFPNATSISTNAFYNCSALTSVNFPNATSIGGSAFYNCSALTSVNFPNATSIGNSAFLSCASLKAIVIPQNITEIDGSAFMNCSSLGEVTMKPTTPPTLGTKVFKNCTALAKIIVPTGCADAYKAATNWSTYADIIVEEGAENLITFTIDGTSYQAEDGMMWGEWCDSAYNTGGFYVTNADQAVRAPTTTESLCVKDALKDIAIQPNTAYILTKYSHGGGTN